MNHEPEQADLEILPQWLDLSVWDEFKKHRRDMVPPARQSRCFTARAQRALLRRLSDLQQSGSDPNAALMQSIERCWTGVFPCDGARKAKGGPSLRSYQNPMDPVRMKLKAANLAARAAQLDVSKFDATTETRQQFEHRVAMAEMQKMGGTKR